MGDQKQADNNGVVSANSSLIESIESCGSPRDTDNALFTHQQPSLSGVKTLQVDKRTKKSSKSVAGTTTKSVNGVGSDNNVNNPKRREAHEVSTTTLLEAQKSSFNQLTEGITAGFNDMTLLLRELVQKGDKQATRKRKYSALSQSDDSLSNDEDDRQSHITDSPSEDNVDTSIDALINENSASKKQKKKGTSFLDEIEQDYELEEAQGAPIDEKLAAIINKMARNKMTEEKLKDKWKTYPTPSNCESLGPAKKVNKEIWSKLRSGTRGRDLKFQQIQTTLAKAVNPLLMLTDKALANQGQAKSPVDSEELAKTLTHSIALILHSNGELSQRRLDLIKPDLNKQYQTICSEVTENSTYLFGDDLAQKIKDINATNRVGQKLSDNMYRGKNNRSSNYGHSRDYSRSSHYPKNWTKPQGRGNKYRPNSANHSKGKQQSQTQ